MPDQELPSYPVNDTCCKSETQEYRQEHEYLRVSYEQGVDRNNLSQVACVCPKDAYPDKAKNTFKNLCEAPMTTALAIPPERPIKNIPF